MSSQFNDKQFIVLKLYHIVIEQISMNPSDSLVILTSSFKKFCLKYTLMRENFLPIVILAKGH